MAWVPLHKIVIYLVMRKKNNKLYRNLVAIYRTEKVGSLAVTTVMGYGSVKVLKGKLYVLKIVWA